MLSESMKLTEFSTQLKKHHGGKDQSIYICVVSGAILRQNHLVNILFLSGFAASISGSSLDSAAACFLLVRARVTGFFPDDYRYHVRGKHQTTPTHLEF